MKTINNAKQTPHAVLALTRNTMNGDDNISNHTTIGTGGPSRR